MNQGKQAKGLNDKKVKETCWNIVDIMLNIDYT